MANDNQAAATAQGNASSVTKRRWSTLLCAMPLVIALIVAQSPATIAAAIEPSDSKTCVRGINIADVRCIEGPADSSPESHGGFGHWQGELASDLGECAIPSPREWIGY
jgi:hypothetical protein